MSLTQWRIGGATNASMGAITASAFDPNVELLWLGDSVGYATGLTPTHAPLFASEVEWGTYCRYRATRDTVVAVAVLRDGTNVYAGGTEFAVVRQGGKVQHRVPVAPHALRKMSFMRCDPFSRDVFVAADTGSIAHYAPPYNDPHMIVAPMAPGATTCLAYSSDSHRLLAATSTGYVSLYDTRDMAVASGWRAGVGKVATMEMIDDTLITAIVDKGTTSVMMYDIRNVAEPKHAVSVAGSAVAMGAYVKSHVPHALVIMPQNFSVVVDGEPEPFATPNYSSVDGAFTSVSISSDGGAAVIGTDKGLLYVLCDAGRETFAISPQRKQPPSAKAPQFTSSWAENKEGVIDAGFDYSVPVDKLFSSWPPSSYMMLTFPQKMKQLVGVPARHITQNHIGVVRSDAYRTDPKDKVAQLVPNPYPFNNELGDDPSSVAVQLQHLRKLQRRSNPRIRDKDGLYTKPEEALQVCYSTHQRFDWSTVVPESIRPLDFVGMDNTLPESWVSPLLQCLFHVHPPMYAVRRALMLHFCRRVHCVACEVSILFHNMAVTASSGGAPIAQLGHLLMTLRHHPSFQAILSPADSRDDAVAKCHAVQRALLIEMDRDLRGLSIENRLLDAPIIDDFDSIIVKIFGTVFEAKRSTIPPRLYWEVPTSATKVDEGLQHLLKQLESHNGDSLQIRSLPPILVLLLNAEHGSLKPPSVLKFSRPPKEEFQYALCSNVFHLSDDVDDLGHFVSHHRTNSEGFVLVNDYVISKPQTEEQLESLIPPTTTHSVIVTYYAQDKFMLPLLSGGRPAKSNTFDFAAKLLLDDPFVHDLYKRHGKEPPPPSFTRCVQSITDILSTDLVALDAEYVTLEWGNKRTEEPDWLRRQRKQQMNLARVSCMLSSFPGDERVIVDDYIACDDEAILDYVTQFSGIHEGDLHPLTSKHRLTTRRAAYLKLRALVDRGCKFVGHGLQQDFRICNIAVPPAQIYDTLELYSQGGRKLSLRFLAYHVLGERVQENEHDSVEDARTSLRLYRKYEELVRENIFDKVMETLRQKGTASNWSVPQLHSVQQVADDDVPSDDGTPQQPSVADTPPSAIPLL